MAHRQVTKGQISSIAALLASDKVTFEQAQAFIDAYKNVPSPKKRTPFSFSAPVVYVQPEFEELKRRFPVFVNHAYEGLRFDPIERCTGVSRENREVAFEYVYMNRAASTTDEVLAEMDRKGLRPALYEELLGFALKYQGESQKYTTVALGSEEEVDGRRCVASLWDGGYGGFGSFGRHLALDRIDRDWSDDCRFLAVRE